MRWLAYGGSIACQVACQVSTKHRYDLAALAQLIFPRDPLILVLTRRGTLTQEELMETPTTDDGWILPTLYSSADFTRTGGANCELQVTMLARTSLCTTSWCRFRCSKWNSTHFLILFSIFPDILRTVRVAEEGK